MEIDKLENKPLENKEIHRFLEASRNSSYNSLDSILSKKEKSFQQKSLLEIASETEARLKTNEPITEAEFIDNPVLDQSSKTDIPNSNENQRAEKNLEEILEEQNKTLQSDLENAQKKISELEESKKSDYERGLADGKKSSEDQSNEKVHSVVEALESAKKSLLNLNATHFIDLREQITKSILKLASDRAGIEIRALPEYFVKKIEMLIETIDQKTRKPYIYLNPEDLEVLEEIVKKRPEKDDFVFKSKPDLLHGDMLVDLGSIKAEDATLKRAGFEKERSIENLIPATSDQVLETTQEIVETEQMSEVESDDNQEGIKTETNTKQDNSGQSKENTE